MKLQDTSTMYPQSKVEDNLTSRFKLKKKNDDGSMFLPQEVKQFTGFSERTTLVKLKTFHSDTRVNTPKTS